ncbi:MAG: hypothetical protein FJ316_02425 [SAR202 cluster bacterium]|nr:hypothetical protein [SAR202 cluster bacterium]
MDPVHARCNSCGQELASVASQPQETALPFDAKREEGNRRLQEYAETLERLAAQIGALNASVQAGAAGSQQILEVLEELRKRLLTRHGLCIQRDCILCRAQEQAIKDHVVLYIDWKVPGTVEKLEQARRGQ